MQETESRRTATSLRSLRETERESEARFAQLLLAINSIVSTSVAASLQIKSNLLSRPCNPNLTTTAKAHAREEESCRQLHPTLLYMPAAGDTNVVSFLRAGNSDD
eukprot:1888905-Rhodomonas_salina.2